MFFVLRRFADFRIDSDVANDQGHEREKTRDDEFVPHAGDFDVIGVVEEVRRLVVVAGLV